MIEVKCESCGNDTFEFEDKESDILKCSKCGHIDENYEIYSVVNKHRWITPINHQTRLSSS